MANICKVMLGALTLSVSTVAAQEPGQLIDPAHLLSLVQADWNDDGRPDKAMLIRSGVAHGDVELRIYLSDDSDVGFELAARHQAIVHAPAGTVLAPQMSASTNGVTVRAGDDYSTTTPWHEIYGISWHEQKFVVARYTVTWHDKRDMRAGFRCDLNLVSGTGIRNTSSLDSVPAAVDLDSWQRRQLPTECQVKLAKE